MTDTPVKFEGTKKREDGGNTALKASAEQHDGPRNKGRRVGQDSPISRCLDGATDSTLAESAVTGTKSREPGAAEQVRRKNNLRRDQNSALGRGKPSDIVL